VVSELDSFRSRRASKPGRVSTNIWPSHLVLVPEANGTDLRACERAGQELLDDLEGIIEAVASTHALGPDFILTADEYRQKFATWTGSLAAVFQSKILRFQSI